MARLTILDKNRSKTGDRAALDEAARRTNLFYEKNPRAQRKPGFVALIDGEYEEVNVDLGIYSEVFSKRNNGRESPLPEHVEQRAVTVDGIRYLSVPDAAEVAQVSTNNFRYWLRHETEINGTPLRTVFLQVINRSLVSEETARRAANRFVKLPSEEPAHDVLIGALTNDDGGYIGMKEAADYLGIARPTMNLWASNHEKSPLKRPLDVIKCTVSGRLYISDLDLFELVRHVPNIGLSRGPRPQ